MQGHREGGQEGTVTLGPMDLGGPWDFRKAVGFSEMTLRKQLVRPEDLYLFILFFWRSHHNSDKTAAFSPSVLEFTKPEIRHI